MRYTAMCSLFAVCAGEISILKASLCGTAKNGELCALSACCSVDGYCGWSDYFCGKGCQSGRCARHGIFQDILTASSTTKPPSPLANNGTDPEGRRPRTSSSLKHHKIDALVLQLFIYYHF
jgi:hypothetical protein